MGAIVKSIKDRVSDAGKNLQQLGRDIVKGDPLAPLKHTKRDLEDSEKGFETAFTPEVPEIPPVNIPEQPVAGAAPGAVQEAPASVSLGATEGQRRKTGVAKGSRKLNVPLGGLR